MSFLWMSLVVVLLMVCSCSVSPSAQPRAVVQPRAGDVGAATGVLPSLDPAATIPPAAAAGPRLSLPETQHDFGQVAPGSTLDYGFVLLNNGTAPLRIERVQSSCGCTVAKLDKQVLDPSDLTELKVVYHPGALGGRRVRADADSPIGIALQRLACDAERPRGRRKIEHRLVEFATVVVVVRGLAIRADSQMQERRLRVGATPPL